MSFSDIKYWITRPKLASVFTPSTAAKLNYIARPYIESVFSVNLGQQGKQFVVFGPSGSGKTTFVTRMLKVHKLAYIKTQCDSNTTFDSLIVSAFDRLNVYYVEKKTLKYARTIDANFKKGFAEFKNSIQFSEEESIKRLVNLQLTIQRLAEYLGQLGAVWVIEDFHKLDEAERNKLADAIKIFNDIAVDYPKVRIICIGAVGTIRELAHITVELTGRVTELSVPLLTKTEIETIIKNGCNMLNLNIEKELVEGISYYSNGLGALVHQMCFDICISKGLNRRRWNRCYLSKEMLGIAIKSFINSQQDTFKELYDVCLSQKEGWHIMTTLSYAGDDEELSLNQISNKINKKKNKFTEEQILEALKLMTSFSNSAVFHNTNTDKYRISTPMWKAFIKVQLKIEKERKNPERRPNIDLLNQNTPESILMLQMLRIINEMDKRRLEIK